MSLESGNIRSPLPDSSKQVWPDLVRRHLATVAGCRQIPAPTGPQRPDVTGLRRQLDTDDRQLLNSGNRTSNVRVRTKSLILENDLRFKTVNRFPKIKETFIVKLKMISINHYFCFYHYFTPKQAEHNTN
jgi:hypothetical protein